MKSLILYSRTYCHLCDDMHAALRTLGAHIDFNLEVIDIDIDASLAAMYDELVPVLAECTTSGEVVPICHHFLDVHALQAVLSARGERK